MSDLKVSDLTGKNIKIDLAYRVDIYSYGQKTRLRLDSEFSDQIKEMCRLALGNGCKWEFWDNTAKKYVPLPEQTPTVQAPPQAPQM